VSAVSVQQGDAAVEEHQRATDGGAAGMNGQLCRCFRASVSPIAHQTAGNAAKLLIRAWSSRRGGAPIEHLRGCVGYPR
jgi:hypothetical protein